MRRCRVPALPSDLLRRYLVAWDDYNHGGATFYGFDMGEVDTFDLLRIAIAAMHPARVTLGVYPNAFAVGVYTATMVEESFLVEAIDTVFELAVRVAPKGNYRRLELCNGLEAAQQRLAFLLDPSTARTGKRPNLRILKD